MLLFDRLIVSRRLRGMPGPMTNRMSADGCPGCRASTLRERWCDPEPMLRSAQASFESLGLGRAANACRRLLTTLGRPAPRRRKTDARLHPTLMAAGVTVREVEVMDLLVERLSKSRDRRAPVPVATHR